MGKKKKKKLFFFTVGILKTIQLGPNATCVIAPAGIKFLTEEARSLQARVFLPVALFDEYS